MAKKRVHEIAKEKGISSKEVLAVLQGAGLDVKAAASSVDVAEAERAFAGNGGGEAKAAPAKEAPAKKAPAKAKAKAPAKDAPEQAAPAEAAPQQKPAPRPQRPVRSDGEGGGGAAGR